MKNQAISPVEISVPHQAPVEHVEFPRSGKWREGLVARADSAWMDVIQHGDQPRAVLSPSATLIRADTIKWLVDIPPNSIHAVVTDPPYGVKEFESKDHDKMRRGRGGVWRIPPSFDGANRQPLPRFTVLSKEEIAGLQKFFGALAYGLWRALVPGGHIFIASNPLLSTYTFHAFQSAGFEKRGEIIRLVQTLRGGDRPKGAEKEFADVSMMPRSCWEPWGVFRKPFNGTAAENLRLWGTSGLRRISGVEPFKDVILCSPTRGIEKRIAPHPSLKPQRFLRQVVRAVLPLGIGTVYDPFAGSGSTLAAAENLGYRCVGTERDQKYFAMACSAFGALSTLPVERK
jgi:site-specific DNA-methyltransferase (adenine-specific)